MCKNSPIIHGHLQAAHHAHNWPGQKLPNTREETSKRSLIHVLQVQDLQSFRAASLMLINMSFT